MEVSKHRPEEKRGKKETGTDEQVLKHSFIFFCCAPPSANVCGMFHLRREMHDCLPTASRAYAFHPKWRRRALLAAVTVP